ncbi:DUF6414 family protein [Thalassolituus hydrocarboniclasticus]|uniref:Uncharacterized protein n=1 Tax=Thalassolituus hydrocarboniclasticus TaxID=2742796 RepID=A0ABY6ADU0_9GAMM|nr:hypothetical protein [Thalassolituus hydrocarboniclasticus]UXD88619.1 hypothetical protein HUF19_14785 [Thalassolituus hydrocarboniclasticus]
MNLFDYLYVDLDKVISLYSQITGGVVELRETQSEKWSTSDNKRNYDFKVFKHDAGGTTEDREQDKTTIKPYHALLQELESELYSSGYLLDLANFEEGKTLKDSDLRATLKNALCIKCSGRVVIEDYERMKKIGQDFPDIVKLINRSHAETLKDSPEYQEIERKIQDLESTIGDRNSQAKAKKKAKDLRAGLDSLLDSSTAVGMVPQWILDGMKTWIDAFLPNITNIRVYPFKDEDDEHIFGHLDASNFTVSDPTAFHFTYGSFPTEEFTILGVITSVPSNEGENFFPLQEFEKEDLKDYESVEHAFRGMFRGFDGIEAMVRTCRYPRVLVHPILVYRQTSPNKALQRTSR